MKSRKGFTLVELMVVVAIIAILAAVGLPMYSTFRQKSRVGTALKSIQGIQSSLISWHDSYDSFAGITIPGASGGILMNNGIRVGSALPELPDGTWTFTVVDSENIEISWEFAANAGCPAQRCNGIYCLTCVTDDDNCYIAVGGFLDNTLGMSKTQLGASASCN